MIYMSGGTEGGVVTAGNRLQVGAPETSYRFQVGDSVYVQRHREQILELCWEGPYLELLTIPKAIKVDGMAAWIYIFHVKPTTSAEEDNAQPS